MEEVIEMNKAMNELRKEIEERLNEERRTLRKMVESGWISSDRNITEGWVEALEYALGRIDDALEGEEE